MPLPMPSILCRAKTKQVHCACCKLLHTLMHAHTLSLPLSVEHSHTHTHSLLLKLSPSLICKLSLSLATRNRPTVGASIFSMSSIWFALSLSHSISLSLPTGGFFLFEQDRGAISRRLGTEIYFFPPSNIFESTFSVDAMHWPLGENVLLGLDSGEKAAQRSDSSVGRSLVQSHRLLH